MVYRMGVICPSFLSLYEWYEWIMVNVSFPMLLFPATDFVGHLLVFCFQSPSLPQYWLAFWSISTISALALRPFKAWCWPVTVSIAVSAATLTPYVINQCTDRNKTNALTAKVWHADADIVFETHTFVNEYERTPLKITLAKLRSWDWRKTRRKQWNFVIPADSNEFLWWTAFPCD